MDPIIVTCTIKVADAIAAGRSRAGRYDHELTETELAVLRSRDLDAVVRPYLAAKGESSGHRLVVTEPSFLGVIQALGNLRESESTARRRRAAELALVKEWGTPNQIARYEERTLPEAEILEIARRIAFGGVSFPQYDTAARLGPKAVRHRKDCDEGDLAYPEQDIHYDTLEGAELHAGQHDALQSLRACVNVLRAPFTDPVVDLKTHTATCSGCGAVAKRPTALVTISWPSAGRTLSREYLL